MVMPLVPEQMSLKELREPNPAKASASRAAQTSVNMHFKEGFIFTPEDWEKYYLYFGSDKIPPCPWGEDILNGPCPFYKNKLVKDTHFLFIGQEIMHHYDASTIIGWYHTQLYMKKLGQPMFSTFQTPDPWFMNESFATRKTLSLRWYLLLQQVIPDSGRTYEEHVATLPPEYGVPSAIEEVTKEMLFYKKYGARLNGRLWALCSDRTSDDYRVRVGYFSENGLTIKSSSDDDRHRSLGIGASRRI